MRRRNAWSVAAALALPGAIVPAAPVCAQDSTPFEEVVLPSGKSQSHTWAYTSMFAGAALAGLSFAVKDRADARYDSYLRATEPAQISSLYDETITLDRLSAASLISGEVLVALGLYIRFVKRGGSQGLKTAAGESLDATPAPSLGLTVRPSRWAISLRF